jgi:hypothetical protein
MQVNYYKINQRSVNQFSFPGIRFLSRKVILYFDVFPVR